MPRPLRYAALIFAIAVSATCGDKNPLGVEANHPPIVDAIQLTIDEDSSGVADVLATARDVDGDSLRLTLWGQGGHGAVAASGG
ncbi:MAG: Ig-like domain-containing protein, partial [Gemmatimonadota bacterium]